MKDFDIAKYLREHQLGSYGILNHYVDLKPLKEEEKTEVEMNAEIPYEGPEHKLAGDGTEFKQADTVSEELDEASTELADFAEAVATAAAAGVSKDRLHKTVDISYPDDSKQTETISEGEFDRLEGLIDRRYLSVMRASVQSIFDDLTDQQFHAEDIEEYLVNMIREAAAFYK